MVKKIHKVRKFYFTGAISSGDRSHLVFYKTIVKILKEFGDVPSEHIIGESPLEWENKQRELGVNVYGRDIMGIDESVALVADISLPTTGGGAEVDYAVRCGKPVLLVHKEDLRGSWYLTQWKDSDGRPHNLTIETYQDSEGLERIVRDFASKVNNENLKLSGAYFVIEGGDGCGKGTQADKLVEYLLSRYGMDVVRVREPGSTEIGEEIRQIVLKQRTRMFSETELLLFEAGRAQLVSEVIKPALKEGKVCVTDRSFYSTEAYQGFGRCMGLGTIQLLNSFSMEGIVPDLGIIIDVNPEVGLRMVTDRNRFENEKIEFHKKVREGYLRMAEKRENVKVVKYIEGNPDLMHEQIRKIVDGFIDKNFVDN